MHLYQTFLNFYTSSFYLKNKKNLGDARVSPHKPIALGIELFLASSLSTYAIRLNLYAIADICTIPRPLKFK